MAKDKGKKDKKSDKAEAKAEKANEREFKFGVDDIAEKLDIKPASVRVQLRNKGVEKAGKSYGWNSKAEMDEVIAQIKAPKEEAEEKPAKGKKASKTDKKAKGKKKSTEEDDD